MRAAQNDPMVIIKAVNDPVSTCYCHCATSIINSVSRSEISKMSDIASSISALPSQFIGTEYMEYMFKHDTTHG
jgi:hypothetical protein